MQFIYSLVFVIVGILVLIEGAVLAFFPIQTRKAVMRLVKKVDKVRKIGIIELIVGVLLLLIGVALR